MEFNEFKSKIQQNINVIIGGAKCLYRTDVDKDELWNVYLDSFPAGTNDIFRERREHDCSSCRHFIKNFGSVVSIKDNVVHTIWENFGNDPTYGPVCEALDRFVKSAPVVDAYFSTEDHVGTDKDHEHCEDGKVITWEHLYTKLPAKFVVRYGIGDKMNQVRTAKQVFKRSLEELTDDSVDTVLELINSDSIYRGAEWKAALETFRKYKDMYSKVPDELKDNFAWEQSVNAGDVVGRIRNHSIGTLLIDISNGEDLDSSVRKYEAIVAPTNYKRPKAIFTKKMLEEAQKTVTDLGYMESLPRRFATLDDITVNNILFADRSVSGRIEGGNVFAEMVQDCGVDPKKFSKATEISAKDFVEKVLPTATGIELLLEGRHKKNMVSLIAPVNADAPSMFKWDNPFSWAYTGNITDSDIRENVKSAGGKVDGVLRFSIQWNDGADWDRNDEDAHCKMPGYHIYFGTKYDSKSGGNLDVDITHPYENTPAVENITWPVLSKMPDGDYSFYVNCYAARGGKSGFRAEIEFDGQVFQYNYDKPLHQNQNVPVAVVHKTGNQFTITHKLPSDSASIDLWGVKTNQFLPVTVIMNSPNYWDDQKGIGNQHYFFMLKDCVNPEKPNGFFNEYLKQDLVKHKRVFEALGGKMAVQDVDDQLSGVGFSTTQRNNVIVRVKGKTDRIMKVVF